MSASPFVLEHIQGGIALNMRENRLSAILHLHIHYIAIALVAGMVLLGYIIVMPGIRVNKFNTCLIISTLVVSSGVNFLSLAAPCLICGFAVTRSILGYHSTVVRTVEVGAHIGFKSVNLTLWDVHSDLPLLYPPKLPPNLTLGELPPNLTLGELPPHLTLGELPPGELVTNLTQLEPLLPNTTASELIPNLTLTGFFTQMSLNQTLPDLKERLTFLYLNHELSWDVSLRRRAQFLEALKIGLPDPILCLSEILLVSNVGTNYGASFSEAGFYACILVYTSIILIGFSFFFFITLPYYGPVFLVFSGVSDALALLVHFLLAAHMPFTLMVDGASLTMTYDWLWYLMAAICCWNVVVGLVLNVVLGQCPDSFETSIELSVEKMCKQKIKKKYKVVIDGNKLMFQSAPLGGRKAPFGIRSRGSQTDPEEEFPRKWTFNRQGEKRRKRKEKLEEEKQEVVDTDDDGYDNEAFVDDGDRMFHKTLVYIDPGHEKLAKSRSLMRSVSVEMLSSPEKENEPPHRFTRRASLSYLPTAVNDK